MLALGRIHDCLAVRAIIFSFKMCHLLLLMPLLALPLFWLLPLPVALSSYALVVAVSGWLYWLALRAMRRPVVTGKEELVGSAGDVVEIHAGHLSVRVHGEVWTATTKDRLRKGDRVRVTKIDGLVLNVSHLDRRGGRRGLSRATPHSTSSTTLGSGD